jgi:flavin-dependent dehydrogenase
LSHVSSAPEVVVAGAGVAGLSAGLLLARAGLRVVCIDPKRFPRARVGESLDWSAPRLLEDLGLSRDELVATGVGTYKREVRGLTSSGELLVGRPPRWLHRWPLRFEHVTLHLDRGGFDQRLYEAARDAGVEFVWDHVRSVDVAGDRIVGCRTRSGERFTAGWFLDASGRRRIVGQAAGIGLQRWGTERISLWSQYDAPMALEGTVLHLDDGSEELSWAWEIPIAANRHSVGVAMSLQRFHAVRPDGEPFARVLADSLAQFPALRSIAVGRLGPVRSRRYRPYVSDRVVGDNWLMIGEAAAFVDPLASIGVTSAIRHGSEAARLIMQYPDASEQAHRRLAAYDRRVRDVAGLYNLAVEELLYDRTLRQRLGMRWASRSYVPLGYLTTSTYTRLNPTTPRRFAALGVVLAFFRAWVHTWRSLSRRAAAPFFGGISRRASGS